MGSLLSEAHFSCWICRPTDSRFEWGEFLIFPPWLPAARQFSSTSAGLQVQDLQRAPCMRQDFDALRLSNCNSSNSWWPSESLRVNMKTEDGEDARLYRRCWRFCVSLDYGAPPFFKPARLAWTSWTKQENLLPHRGEGTDVGTTIR